ncbi:hypothetical protein ACTQ1U_05125 [Thermoguttaceae bacterium LCP21S3_D4]|nr:hypothetical protein [Lachnospiraceae bacterium]HCJ75983.1 hypothetical protein [Roseburia sp.]
MEFRKKLATPAQGSAGEAQMNMDVNLRRLPYYIICITKFLESFADGMWVSIAAGQTEATEFC